jgi:hypothetical protein
MFMRPRSLRPSRILETLLVCHWAVRTTSLTLGKRSRSTRGKMSSSRNSDSVQSNQVEGAHTSVDH